MHNQYHKFLHLKMSKTSKNSHKHVLNCKKNKKNNPCNMKQQLKTKLAVH